MTSEFLVGDRVGWHSGRIGCFKAQPFYEVRRVSFERTIRNGQEIETQLIWLKDDDGDVLRWDSYNFVLVGANGQEVPDFKGWGDWA